jgi:hypothetical protein
MKFPVTCFIAMLILNIACHAQLAATPAKEPRHHQLEVKQCVETGFIANGTFIDIASGTYIGDRYVSIQGIRMHIIDASSKPCGVIFVRKVTVPDVTDGGTWSGMLEPDGAYSYVTVAGAQKLIPAYKVSAIPDPVADFYKRKGR